MRETTLKTLIKTKLSETLKDITWILHGDRDMQSEDCGTSGDCRTKDIQVLKSN